jgi:hypothetical protein
MAHLGTFPFVPDMEDCKKIVETDHGTVYIMNTFCRALTPEAKAAIDQQISHIYLNAHMGGRLKTGGMV